jgi:hypothetical protein
MEQDPLCAKVYLDLLQLDDLMLQTEKAVFDLYERAARDLEQVSSRLKDMVRSEEPLPSRWFH